jgi:V/A-type H+-transporting ATPase subunit D
MPRAPQNPTELRRLRRQLAAFRRVVPSLDLKRRQLALRQAAERAALAAGAAALDRAQAEAAERLPMLAHEGVDLRSTVTLVAVHADQEIVAGVPIPRLLGVEFAAPASSLLGTPLWVDGYAERMRLVVELALECEVRARRAASLGAALMKATQRVNLLEKALIPRTLRAAHAIEVFLADAKRAEVVRAKIAKRQRHAALERAGTSHGGTPQ